MARSAKPLSRPSATVPVPLSASREHAPSKPEDADAGRTLQLVPSEACAHRPDNHGKSQDASAPLASIGELVRVAQLNAEIRAKSQQILRQQAELAHFKKLFERASAAARIGVWHCDLPDCSLTWTDVVYDLFDMERGAPLVREEILTFYPEHSRALLDRIRSRAIAERSGFEQDLEIVSAKGVKRWLRTTATVECESGVPVRIFGMMQDITEEKRLAERLRRLAECDAMTGLANRARFQETLAAFDRPDDPLRDGGVLMIVDLDGFKQINDTFGHATGDDCIRAAAARLASACAGAEIVARIGGDEFAVIWPSLPDGTIALLANDLAAELVSSVTRDGITLPLGASIGIARATGGSSTDLFRRADAAMYAAKSAGRNGWRWAESGGN